MICPSVGELAERLPRRLGQWALQLHAAASCYRLDPYLLAAVIDRESLGGEALTPRGAGGLGDGGHGRGLAQIDDRYHRRFVGAFFDDGLSLWADAAFNLLYAARLLRKLLDRFDQEEAAALCAYNAGPDDAAAVLRILPADLPPARRSGFFDQRTSGRNYVTDTLRRREDFSKEQRR